MDSKLKQSLLSVPEVKLFAGDEQTDEIEQVLAAAGQIVPLAQPVIDLSDLVRSSFLAARQFKLCQQTGKVNASWTLGSQSLNARRKRSSLPTTALDSLVPNLHFTHAQLHVNCIGV